MLCYIFTGQGHISKVSAGSKLSESRYHCIAPVKLFQRRFTFSGVMIIDSFASLFSSEFFSFFGKIFFCATELSGGRVMHVRLSRAPFPLLTLLLQLHPFPYSYFFMLKCVCISYSPLYLLFVFPT